MISKNDRHVITRRSPSLVTDLWSSGGSCDLTTVNNGKELAHVYDSQKGIHHKWSYVKKTAIATLRWADDNRWQVSMGSMEALGVAPCVQERGNPHGYSIWCRSLAAYLGEPTMSEGSYASHELYVLLEWDILHEPKLAIENHRKKLLW